VGDGQLNEGDKVAHGLTHQPYVLDKRKRNNLKKCLKIRENYQPFLSGLTHAKRNCDQSAIYSVGTEISHQNMSGRTEIRRTICQEQRSNNQKPGKNKNLLDMRPGAAEIRQQYSEEK